MQPAAVPLHPAPEPPGTGPWLLVDATHEGDPDAGASPADSAPLFPDRSRITLLVVDDTPAARYALARGLRQLGFPVIEAVNGQQALRLAPLCSAVLLDVQLPDIPGPEVCRLLRESAVTRALPVLHVSALAASEHGPDVGDFGAADGYLVRPVDVLQVARLIEELLRKRAG